MVATYLTKMSLSEYYHSTTSGTTSQNGDAEIRALSFTLLLSMVIGLKVVTMKRFHLEKWLQAVQQYKVTYAHVAPPISKIPSKRGRLMGSGTTSERSGYYEIRFIVFESYQL